MRGSIIGLALTLVVVMASPTSAYSVLTHEAAIDVTWDTTLRPLLLQRFPRTSADALVRARSFAYGGSVIQDLGYYPFGNKFFSNLVHYVRSGDFVEALLREARDVDELAFALGALAHYSNDTNGHPEAVNLTVPMVFPKLQQKYGDAVTYAQAPRQHVIVEFSFDIVHAAGGAYLPDTCKRLIGFRVATPLLERAFRATYGLEMQRPVRRPGPRHRHLSIRGQSDHSRADRGGVATTSRTRLRRSHRPSTGARSSSRIPAPTSSASTARTIRSLDSSRASSACCIGFFPRSGR